MFPKRMMQANVTKQPIAAPANGSNHSRAEKIDGRDDTVVVS
jgi:hypothetical protein